MRRTAAAGPIACFAALGIFWGSWAALIPQIKAGTGSSDGELGFAMLVSGSGAILAMLVVGRLWQRVGWYLLPITGLWFAIAGIGLAMASSPLTLALALFFIGGGSGALDVAMNAAVSDVEVSSGSRLMYGAHALFSLAVLIASVATGFARQVGASPWLIVGTVAVLIAAVALSTIMSARGSHRRTTSAPAARTPATSSGSNGLLSGLAALAILCAVGYLIEDATQNWSALHLERNLGASPALSGAAPGIFAAAMFIGRSSGHRLGAILTERALFSGGAAIAAIGLAILALAPTSMVALAGLAGVGAGIAMVAPALYGRAGREAAADDRGKAIARLTVFGYTGFIVGPALIGFISQAADLRTGIATLAVLAVALTAGGYFVLRGRPERTFDEDAELLNSGRA
ncbi:MAG TPA: MFS transporter [Candidatus Limnocylindria bacterium]|nr:MFS transporter [Candidatus Limnocylindria bacterium]